jgi:hypothetical protein
MNIEAVRAYEQIKDSAAGRVKPAPKVIDRMEPGEAVRQGDLYLIRLAKLPKGLARMEDPSPQLVPGRTRGSRHVITPDTFPACVLYAPARPTEFDGPVIDAVAAFEVSHPEHGHFILPAGVYAVRYQRRYGPTTRRVRD